MTQRDELVRFLKNARARIKPADVGLPDSDRRRTVGLRREEVAALTGMSVTWYTWFEQGRDVQLSAAMLEGLSKTFLLNPQEREFLFALAQHRPPPLAVPPDEVIHPITQHMLDGLNIPAQVITEDWTVIGWNRIVTKIFRDYAGRPASERNLFKILMLDERYRKNPEGFREMARRLTARFKWDYSRTTRIDVFDAIIQEMLKKSKTFEEFWYESEIVAHFEDVHTVNTSGFGDITVQHSSYAIEEAPGQRLILFVPVDDVSRERLAQVVLSES
ncbi:helix-turn-helix transcriptional regulator [Emcibacter sp.]|uniref:helix-turn-helix transcriptional regulator n=1 Tax=Emcibacter sp. TaxID=1979954 RepID=UPI002AA8A954|nr:helix-turn-helix transcriptional regulator [Emcibacter sp.]